MADQPNTPPRFWRTRHGVGLLVMGAAALYYLLTEHQAHLASMLPYLILLACPLMHLFMHHGHGGHGQRRTGDTAGEDSHEPR